MKFLGVITTAVVVFVLALPVQADVFADPVMSEEPAWFEVDSINGGFYGYTTVGTYFTQRPVVTDGGVRLHKFTIAHVSFYVSDRGVFYAENDLVALSTYFTLA